MGVVAVHVVASGLAALLAPSVANAAPAQPEAPAVTPEESAEVPAAALAAPRGHDLTEVP